MSDETRFRRVRAVFRNAVVWGVSWGALGSIFAGLMRLADNIPFWFALLDGIGMGIRIGIAGALAGAAFSAFISVAYRGKSVRDISAAKFGLGGAIFAGAFIPAWIQAMSLITGGGFVPFDLINTDLIYSSLFGGITAAGTILLAHRDAAANPDEDELAAGTVRGTLGAGAGAYQDTAARDRVSHLP
jgi:hypothetical protein